MPEVKSTKTISDTERYVNMVASHRGWVLNWDKELVNFLIEGLTTNWNKYGYYNCPCRLSKADRNKDRDIICPCLYADQDIKEYGHCYCGLYLSKEFYNSKRTVSSIPDRRYL
ncbi:MAG: ferredoxin:thioredoxin reductase [Candidatus Odinarchaeum yellowstonii]|uniref:ferredoxin:thioredoxin reductase n=1 Tax=Odinarchaeota yellowstonii (strain LCB_4) TaxID=1841599 RepID=A0AAF0D2D1_ODILC|nr:MAG: ferredoxin:thioredoxin reductase [Candidatus Odinarchaeum yellowstonii]